MRRSAVAIRRVRADDESPLLEWRNDVVAIQASLDAQAVDLDDHERWFTLSLVNPRRAMYMAHYVGTDDRIGVCRFDVSEAENAATVSINLAPEWRGQGLGGEVLTAAMNTFRADHPSVIRLLAQIREANVPSYRLFTGAGFVLDSTVDGIQTLVLSTAAPT